MAPLLEDAVHSMKGARHVIDLRNSGLVGAVELESRPGAVSARAFEAFLKCWEKGVMLRTSGDNIAIAPPLIVEASQIARIADTLREAIQSVD